MRVGAGSGEVPGDVAADRARRRVGADAVVEAVVSWPDDGLPRFVVADQPYACVLDRAYAWRVVREYVPRGHGQSARSCLAHAEALCASLNLADQRDEAA